MLPSASFPHTRPAGFSLVEIMVGMLIGMLGIIVMMQVFSIAEGQRRATTGGSDALVSGAITLHGLQRDIRQAGYGLGDLKVIGCDVTLPGGVTLNPLAPLTVNHPQIPAGDANTDTLLIAYGNSNSSPQGDLFLSANATGNIYSLTVAPSFSTGDTILVVPWGDDSMPSGAPATPTTRPAQGTACGLSFDTVASTTAATVTATTGRTANTLGFNSLIYNLGPAPRILAYAIRSGNLTRCDFMASSCSSTASADLANPAIWTPIASNIVSLRAQYGRDTTMNAVAGSPVMDGAVDVYDQSTPARQTVASAMSTRCGWMRISTLRLALVGRSDQYEKTEVTTTAPTWVASTAGNPAGSTAAAIDLSGDADWKHYRYKVFQTAVPLRNVVDNAAALLTVVWPGGVSPEC